MPRATRTALHAIGRRTARRLPRAVLDHLPLAVLERLAPVEALVLLYHVVADRPLPHTRHLYGHKSEAEFEADVRYLKRRYRMPPWGELARGSKGGAPLGRPSLLLTFDDGLAQCFDVVRPILLRHQVPCIFFVTRDLVDNRRLFYRHRASLCVERMLAADPERRARLAQLLRATTRAGTVNAGELRRRILGLERADDPLLERACEILGVDVDDELRRHAPYLTTPQIVQLARDGFAVGGHGVTHRHLAHLSADEVEREVVASCTYVQQLTGAREVPFALPFGSEGVDLGLLARVLQRHPFIRGVFGGTEPPPPGTPWLVPRVGVNEPAHAAPNRSGIQDRLRAAHVLRLRFRGDGA